MNCNQNNNYLNDLHYFDIFNYIFSKIMVN